MRVVIAIAIVLLVGLFCPALSFEGQYWTPIQEAGGSPALAIPIAVTEASLKSFAERMALETQLISKKQPDPSTQVASVPALEPTNFWRILGHVPRLVCSVGVPASTQYREWRSRRTVNPWRSDVHPVPNYLMWGTVTEVSNWTSEGLRKRSTEGDSMMAFLNRAGTLGACVGFMVSNIVNSRSRQ